MSMFVTRAATPPHCEGATHASGQLPRARMLRGRYGEVSHARAAAHEQAGMRSQVSRRFSVWCIGIGYLDTAGGYLCTRGAVPTKQAVCVHLSSSMAPTMRHRSGRCRASAPCLVRRRF